MARPTDAADGLATLLKWVGVSSQREVRLVEGRRWRWDLVVADIAIEVDGGGFVAGRHSRGTGMENDAQKMNAATLAGYRVLRFTPAMIDSGEAVETIQRALGVS